MLNQNKTFEKIELASKYSLLNEDIYQFQLYDVNYEQNFNKNINEEETVLTFIFVALDGQDKEGKPARGRILSKKFVPTSLYISSKNGKNNLYRITEALIGRELTKEEEAKGISEKTINFLVSKQLRALIEDKRLSPDKIYQNLVKFLPATTLINALTQEELEAVKESMAKINAKKETAITTSNTNSQPEPYKEKTIDINEIGSDASEWGKLPEEPIDPNEIRLENLSF